MSLAALEANINEHIDSVIQNSSDPIKTRCRELFREPVLKKYDQLAAILKQPFPKGVVAWENVKLLNDFRNILVHFHPEWSGQSGPHSKFSQIRSRKVKRSQFVVGPVFPHNFLSYSCVKWAVRSAIEFDAYYVGSLGLQSLFAKLINPPINLP